MYLSKKSDDETCNMYRGRSGGFSGGSVGARAPPPQMQKQICLVLPPSCFIGIYCILCQILTINLTNKMFIHVTKNISLKTMFKYESNNIIFIVMH